MSKFVKGILGVVPALGLAAVVAAAQAGGAVRGQVKDEFGGVVVGATVTLVDAAGAEKTATTNEEGVYVFNGVAPGRYTVRAAAEGFAAYENAEFTAAAGRQTLDILLSIALSAEEVTVTEQQGVSAEAENNQSALLLKEKDLDSLPDDPDDLAAALQALAGPAAGPNGGQIYIDGFTGGQLPSKESIREIRINSNPFSAEFDQIGFGRIEILTRPGSDRYRGQTSSSTSTSATPTATRSSTRRSSTPSPSARSPSSAPSSCRAAASASARASISPSTRTTPSSRATTSRATAATTSALTNSRSTSIRSSASTAPSRARTASTVCP
ncbi:MAG: carboxypeptidase-like regulatory domain-containing protein [Acidobacteria bacterium]|nr:carboxypeptidase-like regulatory domain-containing protein [Acidobacteriota bacterium]